MKSALPKKFKCPISARHIEVARTALAGQERVIGVVPRLCTDVDKWYLLIMLRCRGNESRTPTSTETAYRIELFRSVEAALAQAKLPTSGYDVGSEYFHDAPVEGPPQP